MQRRSFLCQTAAQALGWSLFALPRSVSAAAAAAAPADPALARRKLVVVMLRGAVDGLSVVAPYAEPAYLAARPTLALPGPGAEDGVIRLTGLFGLHPALARLAPYWAQGSLSFIHASGSPDSTRSHFDAQDYMESGTPGRKSTPDGWMNRLLSDLPGSASPTRAISMGALPARIFSGSASVASLGLGPRAFEGKAIDEPSVQALLNKLYGAAAQGGHAAAGQRRPIDQALARTYHEATEGRGEIQRSMAASMLDGSAASAGAGAGMLGAATGPSADPTADNGAPSARSFAADAKRLGLLIRRDAHTQLAFTSVGGWDTHVNQGGSQGQLANRLSSLGEGLDALAQGLGEALRDTVIVVMSEFGRTVQQNGNQGTDHGRANVMWLLGGPVAGGRVLGEWPGLDTAALADGRDLAVTTDFRHVLGTLLQRHLGVSDAGLAHVFPNLPGRWPGAAGLLRA
jgi:uncharacterized protein (DUF1501 family)